MATVRLGVAIEPATIAEAGRIVNALRVPPARIRSTPRGTRSAAEAAVGRLDETAGARSSIRSMVRDPPFGV
jgi:hypothetical protein